MNNALFEEDVSVDTSKQKAELRKLLEAINDVAQAKGWQDLQDLHFSQEEQRINRLLMIEAKKNPIDEKELYRLQGELKWAQRYASLKTWATLLTHQLHNL